MTCTARDTHFLLKAFSVESAETVLAKPMSQSRTRSAHLQLAHWPRAKQFRAKKILSRSLARFS